MRYHYDLISALYTVQYLQCMYSTSHFYCTPLFIQIPLIMCSKSCCRRCSFFGPIANRDNVSTGSLNSISNLQSKMPQIIPQSSTSTVCYSIDLVMSSCAISWTSCAISWARCAISWASYAIS